MKGNICRSEIFLRTKKGIRKYIQKYCKNISKNKIQE